jgi:hypothetical protein
VGLIVAGLLAITLACAKKSSTSPSLVAPPPTTPALPTIRAVRVPATRVEVDQDVDVTADVDDAGLQVDDLTYVWSANVGSFSGTGKSVRWRLAKGAAPTPQDVTITLTIVAQIGPPDVKQDGGSMTQTAPPFRVHDSVGELTAMGVKFLVTYFGDPNVSPAACVVDFSDTCPGKAAELADVANNRDKYVIQSAQAHLDSISFPDQNDAVMFLPCQFRSILKADGKTYQATGSCILTGVYTQRRWWLCDSKFDGIEVPAAMAEFFHRRVK